MIRALHVPGSGEPLEDVPWTGVDAARGAGGWVWVDVDGGAPDEIDAVARSFALDPLAVEDVRDTGHFPKIDDYGDSLFVVLHGLGSRGGRIETQELDVVCGGGFLLTIHRDPSPSVEAVVAEARRGGAHTFGRPDLAFARLAEIQVRRYLPAVDALEEAIENLEDRAVQGDRTVIGDVQALRRDAIVLRRVIGPQREILVALARPFSPVIAAPAQLRFASVADHHYRLDESLESARTLLAAILETYRSSVSEKTNEVMKILTVYTAIILPLTLLAGIYGMNLSRLPGAGHRLAFPVTVAAMTAVTVGQWGYFASRGFIGRPRSRITRQVGEGLARLAHLPVELVDAAFRLDADRPEETTDTPDAGMERQRP